MLRGHSSVGLASAVNDDRPLAMIFGATGDLGSHLCLGLVRRGFAVVLSGRNVSKLESLYDRIFEQTETESQSVELSIYPIDLSGASPDDYLSMADRIHEEYGRLDLLVHAASVFQSLKPLQQVQPMDWLTSLHVNLSAPWLITQALLPLLQETQSSQVVLIANDPEVAQKPLWNAYGVANAGRHTLSELLAGELRSGGVRVRALSPQPFKGTFSDRIWKDDLRENVVSAEQAAEGVLIECLGKPDA